MDQHGNTNDFQKPVSITMFYGKGEMAGEDIMTRDGLLEAYTLYREYANLKVTVEDPTDGPLEYTIFDLCDRGFSPDVLDENLSYAFITPCTDVTPLQCFKENLDINHPTYQALDPILGHIPALAPYSVLPYTYRPSFLELSDDEIKATVSQSVVDQAMVDKGEAPADQMRGCFFWTRLATFTLTLWRSSGYEWDENQANITKAPGFRFLMYLDGVARIQYRMASQRPAHARRQNIEEARKKISKLWADICADYNEHSKLLEVSNLEDFEFFTNPRLEAEGEKMNWGYIISGVTLLNIYCILTSISVWHPNASRAGLAGLGLLFVAISQVGAFGIYFLCGKDLNPAMIIAMPLIALGLAVDDMFVLIRYFSDLGYDFISQHDKSEVIGEVFARAGPGTTLTSVCNVLVFSCGAFLPIPAMADFCVAAVCIAAINYVVMMNLLMPAMCLEVDRIQKSHPELSYAFFCHRSAIARNSTDPQKDFNATCSEEFAQSPEKSLRHFLLEKYAPALTSTVGRFAVSLAALAFLAVCIYLAVSKSIGYAPAELFEKSDPAYRGLQLLFSSFPLFPAFLCFHDLNVPKNQADMLHLYRSVTTTQYSAPYLAAPYVAQFADFMAFGPLMQGGDPTDNLIDAGFADAAEVGNGNYTHYGIKDWLKYGPYLEDNEALYWERFTSARFVPRPNESAKIEHALYPLMDLALVNEFTFTGKDTIAAGEGPQSGPVQLKVIPDYSFESSGAAKFSFFLFFGVNLESEDLFVDALLEQKGKVDNSPLKDNAFIYGPIFTFWEVFGELEMYFLSLVGIGMAIIFAVTLVLFSFDVLAALITCFSCCMIVFEIYGLSAFFMNFNIFVAAISLMGLALSVEFTAHFAAAFSLGSGSPRERLGEAMTHTFPAIVEGSVSTLLSVIPLAFHPALFMVKYLFGIISLVVLVGLVNGLLFMPALLAVISPILRLMGRESTRQMDKDDTQKPTPDSAGASGNTSI